MIDEKKFIDLCKSKGLATFKVTTELDDETDIVLDTENLEMFFELCKYFDTKCVFYSYTVQNKDSYELDKEELIEHIKEFIDNDELKYKYNPFGFHDDVINSTALLEKYDSKIEEIIEKQKRLLEKCSWDKPLILEVFISNNGDRIGIIIFDEDVTTETELKWNAKLIDELDKELEKDIESMYAEHSKAKAEMYEKEREDRDKRYNDAIAEIKNILQTSEKILECTNGKLRHAYARDLADEYSERFDCYITIGTIDVFVEEEYRKRKNSKKI
ncbi:MAG: hypothetical protein IJZ55_02370 [Lachnospiraceae bacterium]|nr:hypothetical protein [Lachnospiraceae bacterium]